MGGNGGCRSRFGIVHRVTGGVLRFVVVTALSTVVASGWLSREADLVAASQWIVQCGVWLMVGRRESAGCAAVLAQPMRVAVIPSLSRGWRGVRHGGFRRVGYEGPLEGFFHRFLKASVKKVMHRSTVLSASGSLDHSQISMGNTPLSRKIFTRMRT